MQSGAPSRLALGAHSWGTIGLFTCVGCVLPVVGAVVGLFGGAASAVQPATTSYGLATALFVGTVLLLLVVIPLETPGR